LTRNVDSELIGPTLELRLPHKDGSWRTIEARGMDLTRRPAIGGMVVNCRDMTERKRAEQLLQQTKDELESKIIERTAELERTTQELLELIAHSPTVIYSAKFINENYRISTVTENVSTLLGYVSESFLQEETFWKDHVHPQDLSRVLDEKKNSWASDRTTSDYRFLAQDGNYHWIRDRMKPVLDAQGTFLAMVGSWSDITQQRLAEESRRQSETRYQRLFGSLRDAFVSVDMSGRIIQCNSNYLELLGYQEDEILCLTHKDINPEKWLSFEDEIVGMQILPRGYSEVYEKEYRQKDGTVIPVELRTFLIRDETGNPREMWSLVRDIQHRKRMEYDLQTSRDNYRILLDHSLQGILVFQDMRMVYVNQAFSSSMGFPEKEIMEFTAKQFIRRVLPEDRGMVFGQLRKRIYGANAYESFSMRVLNREGEVRWFDTTIAPISFEGLPALQLTVIDRTSRIKTEHALQQSEAQFRMLVENAPIAVAVSSGPADRFEYLSRPFLTLFGYTLSDLPDLETFESHLTPARENHPLAMGQEQGGNRFISDQETRNKSLETTILCKNGDQKEIVLTVIPIADRKLVFCLDQTSRKQGEAAIRQSEERYRTLAAASPDLIFIVDHDDRIQYVNSIAAQY
jgi:PAS domain S-box-containing protein